MGFSFSNFVEFVTPIFHLDLELDAFSVFPFRSFPSLYLGDLFEKWRFVVNQVRSFSQSHIQKHNWISLQINKNKNYLLSVAKNWLTHVFNYSCYNTESEFIALLFPFVVTSFTSSGIPCTEIYIIKMVDAVFFFAFQKNQTFALLLNFLLQAAKRNCFD